jgi:hypothetical protein
LAIKSFFWYKKWRRKSQIEKVNPELDISRDCSSRNAINGVQSNRLDFLRIVEPNFETISRAFKSQMIIPEFSDFCSTIQDIFQECQVIKKFKNVSMKFAIM